VLLFEEFHHILDTSGKEDLIQKLFRQVRKYGTCLMVIDQTPSLIPNAVFENLNTKLSFSLSHKQNLSAMASAMQLERNDQSSLGLLRVGQAVCKVMGRYGHPFLIKVPFKKAGQFIGDEAIADHMHGFYPEQSPESPLIEQRATLLLPTIRATPSPLEQVFLQDILVNPFDGVDKRGKRLGLSPREVGRIKEALLDMKLIRPVTIQRKKLFELTADGEDTLAEQGFSIDRRHKSQGLEHRYFVDQIARKLKANGWEVFPEKHDIDLIATRGDEAVAMEIETGANNTAQLTKNLDKLSGRKSKRFMLACSQEAWNKTQPIHQEHSNQDSAIELLTVSEFLKSLSHL
jgi:hypothetical protein